MWVKTLQERFAHAAHVMTRYAVIFAFARITNHVRFKRTHCIVPMLKFNDIRFNCLMTDMRVEYLLFVSQI